MEAGTFLLISFGISAGTLLGAIAMAWWFGPGYLTQDYLHEVENAPNLDDGQTWTHHWADMWLAVSGTVRPRNCRAFRAPKAGAAAYDPKIYRDGQRVLEFQQTNCSQEDRASPSISIQLRTRCRS